MPTRLDAFFLTGTDEHGRRLNGTAEGLGGPANIDVMADIIK